MTVSISISDTAKALADALVASGRFATVDEAVEAAIWRLDPPSEKEDEDLSRLDLSPEDRDAIAEGLADAKAGRLIPAEEIYAELRTRFGKVRA